MDIIKATLREKDSPRIRVKITGITALPAEVEAIIDTGYTGFIQIPHATAKELGLIYRGQNESVLADGSSRVSTSVSGLVTLGNRSEVGAITVSLTGRESLLGMACLRAFNMILYVNTAQESAGLIDQEAWLSILSELNNLVQLDSK